MDNDGGRQDVNGNVLKARLGKKFGAQGLGFVLGIHGDNAQVKIPPAAGLLGDNPDESACSALFGALR